MVPITELESSQLNPGDFCILIYNEPCIGIILERISNNGITGYSVKRLSTLFLKHKERSRPRYYHSSRIIPLNNAYLARLKQSLIDLDEEKLVLLKLIKKKRPSKKKQNVT